MDFITPARLVIAILATWRIASLLVEEEGPFNLFGRLRTTLLFWKNLGYSPAMFLYGLISCLWCMSIWVGAVVTAIMLTPLWWLLTPFALSAGAIALRVWGLQTYSGYEVLPGGYHGDIEDSNTVTS